LPSFPTRRSSDLVLPISSNNNELERSYGGNFDINYKTIIGEEVSFSINQLFFYTYLDNPLLLELQTSGLYQFVNTQGYIDTRGTETNMKIAYDDFKRSEEHTSELQSRENLVCR